MANKTNNTVRESFGVRLVSLIVGVHGLFIIASTLLLQLAIRHHSKISFYAIDIPLLLGMGLIYLSLFLKRRKRTAWIVTIIAYSFYTGLNLENLIKFLFNGYFPELFIIKVIILPLVILVLLFTKQYLFIVRSDIQGFAMAAKFSVIILFITFIYGVSGFLLLDKVDFHQNISLYGAIHHTIDQFDLTTNHTIHAYTRRGHFFLDSLSFISVGSLIYIVFSLFQPFKAYFSDQSVHRQKVNNLLHKFTSTSEDFFKLWPMDKQYLFNSDYTSALAIKVNHGVALALGDPTGDPETFDALIKEYNNLCFNNDWIPSHIHIDKSYNNIYLSNNYSLQKIGQEAVVNINYFNTEVVNNKYFRHIKNKFNKQHYSFELLSPPHHQAVLDRLQIVSDEWLKLPGRVERGFAMGYFNKEYLNQCQIAVVRDAANTIQAFLNIVPANFDTKQATYDLLRHTKDSLSNINDYLLIYFMVNLQNLKYIELNLGLCPLAGLNEKNIDDNFITNILRFAYDNGDKLYSFSGLYRFKSKYKPIWQDRFIAYQGGIRGFSKTITALNKAMQIKYKK